MKTSKPVHLSRRTIYIIIFIGVLTLAALNFAGWLFLQSLKSDLTVELKRQFLHVGQVSARLINGNDLENLLPGMENSVTVRAYQQLLYDIKIGNDLENIVILDPAGRLLVDYRLNYRIGDTLFAFPLQRNLLQHAAVGETPEPYLLHNAGQYFLSACIPIFNDQDETVAALAIDAPLHFFDTLQKFGSGVLYIGAGGLLILLVFSAIIISATRRLFGIEAQLLEQQRLAQLGQMAASVAHEIRNPLSIMKGTAEVLQKKYAGSGEEMFSYIPEEIDRLNRLVEDFLQFARQRKLELRKGSITDIIRTTVQQAKDSRVTSELPDDLPEILMDTDAMRQILLNLVRNALDAIDAGGGVKIKAFSEKSRNPVVIVEVTDTGRGISAEDAQKVFDPFFSTKANGSGLGLTISRQLVEQMHGSLNFRSKPEKGTTVQLVFPSA